MYAYKMVQIPQNIVVEMKAHKGNEAAAYLEGIVGEHAASGWEFFRIDSVGVRVQPGCIEALLGRRALDEVFYVATFRKSGA